MPDQSASDTNHSQQGQTINSAIDDPAVVTHKSHAHDSAKLHVSGEAVYADDIAEPVDCLHCAIGYAPIAAGTITKLDLTDVVAADQVVLVLTADDIPGVNDISPTGLHDEPVFASDTILFHGQPLFAVIATDRESARRACSKVTLAYDEVPPKISIDDVVDAASGRALPEDFVTTPLTLQRGDARAAIAASSHQINGTMRIGGQDHFYLESHIAMAVPGEADEMLIYSSTQHPTEVQHMVSHVLAVPSHAVTVSVRRMGGGFGGKETQSNIFAVIAAVAARKTGKAVKFRPDRDDDMRITGKRHDFRIDYRAGFNDEGVIDAVDALWWSTGRYACRTHHRRNCLSQKYRSSGNSATQFLQ